MTKAFIETLAPAFVAGDTPGEPLELTVTDAPAWTTGASVTWHLEAGTAEPAPITPATFAAGVVSFTIPPAALAEAGLVVLLVALTGTDGKRERLEPVRVAVEPASSVFLTLAEIRAEWADAPESNATLYRLSSVSVRRILEWAPNDPDDDATPTSDQYRAAHLQQMRAAWNAAVGTTSDQLGDGEFAVTVYPLDWHVKNTLRSRDPAGGVW